MPEAFACPHIRKLAAATSVIWIAAFITATPAGLDAITDPAGALSADLPPAEPPVDVDAISQEALGALGYEAADNTTITTIPDYTSAESLPAAGVLVTFRINQPHDAAFMPTEKLRPFNSLDVAITSMFSLPQTLAMARLPNAKPEVEWPLERGTDASRSPIQSSVLAYVPASQHITAPFDAVMGDLRTNPGADEPTYYPRPRPDPDTVLAWLDGRALGQFAPGQHYWVRNKLPDSVYNVAEQKCLAEGIYFEARGESEMGQAAVAQVILNRVRNPAYPDTICKVVYQNKHRRNACQFSFACDGRPERIYSQRAWRIAQRVARDVTDGTIWVDEIGDSTHYYANYVRPGWGRRMIRMDQIGAHIFFRTKRGGWS